MAVDNVLHHKAKLAKDCFDKHSDEFEVLPLKLSRSRSH